MIWPKLILFLIGLAILVCAYWRNRGKLTGEARLAWLSATIFFALSFFIEHVLPGGTDPDYESLHRPYLEPSLVIKSVNERGVTYHYTINNVGKMPARQLVFSYQDPNHAAVDRSITNPRDLASGATMLLPVRSDPVAPLSTLSLFVFYESMLDGKRVFYHTRFRFMIPEAPTLGSQSQYLSATRGEGEMSFADQKEAVGFSTRFESETGSHTFWFDRYSLEPSGRGVFFSIPERQLEFIPHANIIMFRHINAAGKEWQLTHPLQQPTNRWHFVAVSWSPTGALLGVDNHGVQVYEDGHPETW